MGDSNWVDDAGKREDDIFQQNISSYAKKMKDSEVRQNLICSLAVVRLLVKDSENAKETAAKKPLEMGSGLLASLIVNWPQCGLSQACLRPVGK